MNVTNIVALEIGSSKIKGAVGEVDQNGVLTVQAVEEEPIQDWVRYGVVSNAEEVANHALKVIENLEARCNNKTIQAVYLAVGCRSMCSKAVDVERVLPTEQEIPREVIAQMLAEATTQVSTSRDVFDVVPREYIVDKSRVLKPIGTLGRSITMRANIITCRPQVRRNLNHLINEKLGLDIHDYRVRQIVEGDFVLAPDEKRLGCMLVDCGAETTTVSIYKHGHLQYLQTLPLGSRNVTRDITHLNFLEEKAEVIKKEYGNAKPGAPVNENVDIDVAMVNKYVAARAGEIIANIKEQVKLAGFQPKDLPSGIILVGKGARLAGLSERLGDVTGMKVRLGTSVRSDVRLADPRISLTDSVDVISTLYAASRNNPMECMAEPEIIAEPEVEEKPVETVVETTVVAGDKPEPELQDLDPVTTSSGNQHPGGHGGDHSGGGGGGGNKSWFERMTERLIALVGENEDEDDGVMRDDD